MSDPTFELDRYDGSGEPLPDPTEPRPFQVGDTVRVIEITTWCDFHNEMQAAIGHAGEIARFIGYAPEPVWEVNIPDYGIAFCNADGMVLIRKAVR